MKKLMTLVVVLAVGLLTGSAMADTVTFSTTGAFGAGLTCGGNPCSTFGSGANTATVQFLGAPSHSYTPIPPTATVTLGGFQAEASGTGASGSDTFSLTIHQTDPSSGTGDLSAVVTGTWVANSGGGVVTFTTPSVQIGEVIYTILNSPVPVEAGPTGGTFGPTDSIQASVNTIPEPASMALLGSGLIGIGGLVRRKLM